MSPALIVTGNADRSLPGREGFFPVHVWVSESMVWPVCPSSSPSTSAADFEVDSGITARPSAVQAAETTPMEALLPVPAGPTPEATSDPV